MYYRYIVSLVTRIISVCQQPQQPYQSLCDVTSAVASVPVAGPVLGGCTDHSHYNNDDSRSNTDTASETSASPYDCSDGSTTCDRRRRCSRHSRRQSGYHGGRRREEPPAVFSSLAEKKAWERERLKKDNHNTSMHIVLCRRVYTCSII